MTVGHCDNVCIVHTCMLTPFPHQIADLFFLLSLISFPLLAPLSFASRLTFADIAIGM